MSKTYGLLLESLRHVKVKGFRCNIFRRSFPRITAAGALWDESQQIYPLAGGKDNISALRWEFPSGARVQFAHLQHERNLRDWHGAQICLLAVDEVTEMTGREIFYLLSRNRSTCGVRPYARFTCNPDPESFLVCRTDGDYDTWGQGLISWWIDPESGYPIAERSGVLRWFVRDGDDLIWGDSKHELEHYGRPRSITFIPSALSDNPTLERMNPEYRANLEALPEVERERLLGGNWKVRASAGNVFPRDSWRYTDRAPDDLELVRGVDKAVSSTGHGARTGAVLIGRDEKGRFYVVDAVAGRWETDERESKLLETCRLDEAAYGSVEMVQEIEPGSSGRDAFLSSVRGLSGYNVTGERATGTKQSRWAPFSAQVRAGNVTIVKGPWDWTGYVRELDQLSGDKTQDSNRLCDLADASALAFSRLTNRESYYTGDILATGDDPLEHQPFTDQEVHELPEFLRNLVQEARSCRRD